MVVAAFLSLQSNLQAKVNIFACEPEWKSLAQEIGRGKVKTFSATTAFQDPHHIRAKPSLVSKIMRADLLICSGAELEVGWLPLLLNRSKPITQFGNIGNLMAANYVTTIEIPKILDRSLGDIHSMGNPHIHLDPYNILIIAKELKNRLQKIDPKNTQNYQENYDIFTKKWNLAIKKWEDQAKNLAGTKIIVHHRSFSYLAKWLKLELVTTLEPRPGIAPTSRDLQKTLEKLRITPANVILLTPFDPTNASNWVRKKIEIDQLILPFTIGGNEESKDLFSLFDSSIKILLKIDKNNGN